jgi:orotate phosphoribosyltransferase
MTANEARLLELIERRAFKRGSFKLASGLVSDYYIDGKMIEVHPECAYLIGQVLYDRTKDLEVDAIGGLEVGAVPLTTSTVMTYFQNKRTIEGFWVREKEKAHGTKKQIEGKLEEGSRVVILDDVITKGQSAKKALDAVVAMGCEVVQVLCLVDRMQGADEVFRDYDFRSVFTIEDVFEAEARRTGRKNGNTTRTPELVAR